MELTINRRELARALDPIAKIGDRKTTMPMLEHLRIVAADGVIGLSATNLYQSGRTHAPAAIAHRGDICVPAGGFAAAIAKMPDGDMNICSAKDSLELRAGRARVRLPTRSADDFPDVQLSDEGTWVALPGEAVREALSAGWAAGVDSARPMFCTLLFELSADRLRGVSVDGYVLARHDVSMKRGTSTPLRCVIPSPAIALLQRVVGNAETVDVMLGARSFEVRVGPVHFATVLADDHFPPYENFVPKSVTTRARVVRATLIEAIDRASLALDVKSPAIEVQIAGGVLSVRSESGDRGTAGDSLDVDQDGPDVTFYIAPNRMRDAVKNHLADEVQINVADPLQPITVTDPQDDARLTLACPMDMKR